MTKPQQLPFDLGHRQAYGREDFWVSGSNSDAVAWLDKWPDWPAPVLLLHGAAGCGKTHLMHVWQGETSAVPVTPGDLAVTSADILLGDAKAVMIDDARRIAGDRVCEEGLFHLYNLIRERGGHLLLAADKPVHEWGLVLPDLQSRLLAGVSVAVGSPDDALMAVVLTKLFSDRQIFVPQDVIQYILPRVERSFQALRMLATAIDHKALAEKRAVTVPLVREILS